MLEYRCGQGEGSQRLMRGHETEPEQVGGQPVYYTKEFLLPLRSWQASKDFKQTLATFFQCVL